MRFPWALTMRKSSGLSWETDEKLDEKFCQYLLRGGRYCVIMRNVGECVAALFDSCQRAKNTQAHSAMVPLKGVVGGVCRV